MKNEIIKIQSIYRGYKKRKYLNNFYKKLPCDIQRKILYFIKKDFYIERENKKLDFIVRKKINKYLIDFNEKLINDNYQKFTLLLYINKYENKIINIFQLYLKYNSIIKDKLLYNSKLKNNLKEIENNLKQYKNKIFNIYSNYIYDNVNNIISILKVITIQK